MKTLAPQQDNDSAKPFYILIGSFFLEKDLPMALKKYSKAGISVSNYQYEKKLIQGFNETGANFTFISAPSIGGWPLKNKCLRIGGFSSDKVLQSVSYLSPYGFLNFFKGRAIARTIKKYIKRHGIDKNASMIHVVCCEAHRPYLIGAKWIKKHFPKQSFCTLIVPDMPEDMTKSKNPIYRFLKKRDVKSIASLQAKYVDSFLCFTGFIEKALAHYGKPSAVMEGIIGCPETKKDIHTARGEGTIHCVFIGKTDRRNGIPLILEAAKLAPSCFVFDIFGSGDMDDELRGLNCPNVKYHGFLEPSKMVDVLAYAEVVLSPRKPEGKYIYYSFPSKIFDYIAYGKKIVTYRLPCYFQDLDEVLFYPADYSPTSFVAAIKGAVEADEQVLIQKYSELKTRFSPAAAAEGIKSLASKNRPD